MKTLSALLAISVSVAAGLANLSAGQGSGAVSFRVTMPQADYNGRVYRPLDVLEIRFDITNETPDTVLMLDAAQMRSAVLPTLSAMPNVAMPNVLVEWEGYPESSTDGMSADGSVPLPPRRGASWRITLRRSDGQPFGEGLHVVNLRVSGSAAAFRDSTGGQWKGRIPGEGQTAVRAVTIRPPGNRQELLGSHLFDASRASSRGDFESALQAYQRAAEVEPDNAVILSRVALALLNLKRYNEAVQAYERLVELTGLGSSWTVRDLAEAYVGKQDETNARRVLIQAGVPLEQIESELRELRSRVLSGR